MAIGAKCTELQVGGPEEFNCGRGLAPDGGLTADQEVGSNRVHIRCCVHGGYGFRPYGGSLLEERQK
jgi:hypothetical protein